MKAMNQKYLRLLYRKSIAKYMQKTDEFITDCHKYAHNIVGE